MEGNYPMNLSQRGFSREGQMRVPSRERQANTPEIRKKATGTIGSKTTLSVSGQNFFNSSQQFEGTSSSVDDLSLATLNIAVDETAFISTAKVDILQLQEEINKMDNDGRIRNTNTANILKKNHTYAMAKFLSKVSNLNVKNLLDKRIQHASTFDTDDLLKFMGVRSESDGLRKLFKILGVFDLMVLKLTEFHTVSFMKYEQNFESLRKQLGGQPSAKLAGMDSGINLSRFQVDLANMERLFELFSFVGKLSQQNRSSESRSGSRTKIDEKNDALGNLSSIEDLYNSLKNGENLGFNAELNDNLVNLIEKSLDFRVKENSLEKKIRSLERELKEQGTKLSTMVEITAGPGSNNDLEKEYEKKIDELQRDNENVRKELEAKFNKEMRSRESELKEKVRKLEYEVEVKGDELSKLQGEIEKLKASLKQAQEQKTEAPVAAVKESAKDDVYNTDYYLKMIKQIEDNFAAKSKDVETENHKKDQDIINLRTKIETFESERDDYKSRLLIAENQLEKDARLRLKGEDASFEAALREQFAAMKEGFENKIKSLMNEIQAVKKEKSLEILETKRDLQREKEGRELLLRKLQIYSKN